MSRLTLILYLDMAVFFIFNPPDGCWLVFWIIRRPSLHLTEMLVTKLGFTFWTGGGTPAMLLVAVTMWTSAVRQRLCQSSRYGCTCYMMDKLQHACLPRFIEHGKRLAILHPLRWKADLLNL